MMAQAEGRPEGREGDPGAGDSLVRADRPLTRVDPEQMGLLPKRSMAESSRCEAEKEPIRQGEDISDCLVS